MKRYIKKFESVMNNEEYLNIPITPKDFVIFIKKAIKENEIAGGFGAWNGRLDITMFKFSKIKNLVDICYKFEDLNYIKEKRNRAEGAHYYIVTEKGKKILKSSGINIY